jgi:hypothetical protein
VEGDSGRRQLPRLSCLPRGCESVPPTGSTVEGDSGVGLLPRGPQTGSTVEGHADVVSAGCVGAEKSPTGRMKATGTWCRLAASGLRKVPPTGSTVEGYSDVVSAGCVGWLRKVPPVGTEEGDSDVVSACCFGGCEKSHRDSRRVQGPRSACWVGGGLPASATTVDANSDARRR